MKEAEPMEDWPRKGAEPTKGVRRESGLRILRLFVANGLGSALSGCGDGIFHSGRESTRGVRRISPA